MGGPNSDAVAKGTVDAAGNVYLAGAFRGPATFGSVTLPGTSAPDGYLTKFSPAGSLEWVQPTGGAQWSSVSTDAAGVPYVVGYFSNTMQFGAVALTSAGSTDVVVASYTSLGQPRWAQQAGGAGQDVGRALGIAAGGGLYVRGLFTGPCAFGPLTLTSTGTETFVASLSSSALATGARQLLALGLYPNPTREWVRVPSVLAGSRVQVLDAAGRLVRTATVGADLRVAVPDPAPGCYTLRATDDQGQPYLGRLLLE